MQPLVNSGHTVNESAFLRLAIACALVAALQGCESGSGGSEDQQPQSGNAVEMAAPDSEASSHSGPPTGSPTDVDANNQSGSIGTGGSGSDNSEFPESAAGAVNPDESSAVESSTPDTDLSNGSLPPEPVPEFNALPDSDLDGILDVEETQADRDRDSIPNYLDLDSDGDGISDALEGTADQDTDTIPNFLDLDSDGDSGSDRLEGVQDIDQDGLPNYLDTDSDNDGLRDLLERWSDSDADGVVDAQDLDSDNDSISDLIEGLLDSDADGTFNYLDEDSDGDGLADAVEGADDFDSDGLMNAIDLDSDNDGVSDAVEGATDLDADGSPDYLDVPLVPVAPAELHISFNANNLLFTWNDVPDADQYQLYRNVDGVSGFEPIGEVVTPGVNQYTVEIDVHLSVESSFLLQSCAQNGCLDSNEQFISEGLVNAIGYLKPSHNQSEELNYGTAVAISADAQTMVVAAPGDTNSSHGINGSQLATDPTRKNSGAVFVYAKTPEGWTEQAFIKADNSRAADFFGQAIAVSGDGNILAIGAPREDSNSQGIDQYHLSYTALDSGAVYIFSRVAEAWLQSAYIKSANSDEQDRFGSSIALSADGTTLAVGAPFESSNSTGVNGNDSNNASLESGAAYVFSNPGTGWIQQAYVKPIVSNAGDRFGASLSLDNSGQLLAVGAPGEDGGALSDSGSGNVLNSGAAYIFHQQTDSWIETHYLKSTMPGEDDAFGLPVALSGNGSTLAVSAINEDSNSIGVDGDEQNNFATNAGSVYVFDHDGANWSKQAYLKPPATKANSLFGRSLSFTQDGDVLAVGASGDASSAIGLDGDYNGNTASFSGAVHLFGRDSGSWSYARFIKASNTELGDSFGAAVSISADGKKLLVGASQEQSSSVNLQGDADNNDSPGAGAAYLY